VPARRLPALAGVRRPRRLTEPLVRAGLLSILAGVDAPTAGRARVAGHDLLALSRRERVAYRRHVGAAVAGLPTGPLALRLVAGGPSDPPLVVPWWIVVPALLVVASLLGMAAVETSVRRRERVGPALRAGTA
jgi:hypothetical protein